VLPQVDAGSPKEVRCTISKREHRRRKFLLLKCKVRGQKIIITEGRYGGGQSKASTLMKVIVNPGVDRDAK
jgi:hypothetical protein